MVLTKDQRLDEFLHPFSIKQGESYAICPHREWMGEDLIHCPGYCEHKCKLQKERDCECNIDYKRCDCADPNICEFYKTQLTLTSIKKPEKA